MFYAFIYLDVKAMKQRKISKKKNEKDSNITGPYSSTQIKGPLKIYSKGKGEFAFL